MNNIADFMFMHVDMSVKGAWGLDLIHNIKHFFFVFFTGDT